MKRTRLNPVSKKQSRELMLRSRLKKELIEEVGNLCMTCGSNGGILGLSLSHKIPLSRGGQTDRNNCLIECDDCHRKYEKHPERRPE